MLIKTVSPPLAVLIIVLALMLTPARVQAQCPQMSVQGTTVGDTRFNTVKSQMWYNDGLWWGAFSDNATGIFFYTFANDAATKGAPIDASVKGVPDVLWDGTNLFVLVWKSVSLATLYKYSYDTGTKTYSLISGFPVQIPLHGGATSAIVLDKDSTGKLWATYTGTQGGLSDGKIHVIWTTSADHTTWDTAGATLESGLTPNKTEISAITHFGGDKMGVVWSNQPGKEIAFRYHVDGQPESDWSAKEIVDYGLGPRGLGAVSNDHLSIQSASDGRLFLAAKDRDNDGTPAHQDESRIWLYVRSVAGVWGSKTVIQADLSQSPTRPVLLLDVTNSDVFVIYHDSISGLVFSARSSMNNPSFNLHCLFSTGPASNPTSTKQNVTSTTGMMAAASTGATASNEIVFRLVDLTPIEGPPGIKCDVAPRLNGNGTITISDWVQIGRFAAALDIPNRGNEFQRADANGNGFISIADWVKCGQSLGGIVAH
jgi:hypothetical protein